MAMCSMFDACEVVIQFSLVLFSVFLAWALNVLTEPYPDIMRFGGIWSLSYRQRRANVKLLIFCWLAIAVAAALAMWSLVKVRSGFMDGNLGIANPQRYLVYVSIPVSLLLAARYVSRYCMSVAWLVLPLKETIRWAREGRRTGIEHSLGEAPLRAGCLRLIDTSTVMFTLLITPAILTQLVEPGHRSWLWPICTLPFSIVLPLPYDREAYRSFPCRAMLAVALRLGLLASCAYFMFTTVFADGHWLIAPAALLFLTAIVACVLPHPDVKKGQDR